MSVVRRVPFSPISCEMTNSYTRITPRTVISSSSMTAFFSFTPAALSTSFQNNAHPVPPGKPEVKTSEESRPLKVESFSTVRLSTRASPITFIPFKKVSSSFAVSGMSFLRYLSAVSFSSLLKEFAIVRIVRTAERTLYSVGSILSQLFNTVSTSLFSCSL